MKHLPLILVALFLAAVQIGSMYWFTQRQAPVAGQLQRMRVDVTDGVIYAQFDTTTLGMTPHAALQMQSELTRTIIEIQRRAQQVH